VSTRASTRRAFAPDFGHHAEGRGRPAVRPVARAST
jgi:hypothetical protein